MLDLQLPGIPFISCVVQKLCRLSRSEGNSALQIGGEHNLTGYPQLFTSRGSLGPSVPPPPLFIPGLQPCSSPSGNAAPGTQVSAEDTLFAKQPLQPFLSLHLLCEFSPCLSGRTAAANPARSACERTASHGGGNNFDRPEYEGWTESAA